MDLDYILGYLIGLGSILLTGKALLRGLTYESNKIAPNQVLDASTALEAFRRGNYTQAQLQDDLSSAGLDATRIAVLQLLQETLLSSGDAVSALYRGTITEAQYEADMKKLGFSVTSAATIKSNFTARLGAGDVFEAEHRAIPLTDSITSGEQELYAAGFTQERVALLRKLSLRVPQLQDLFTFASWNVEDAAARAAGGLDDGKPADYYERSFAAGYDKETADLMWASHWTPPPVFILHTLFQTGQLSEEDLAFFLKVAQHPPGFIPKIVNAFYKQLSESQIVGLLQNGIIHESDVDGLLRNNGYNAATIALIHQEVMIKASLPSAEEKAAMALQKQQFKSLNVGTILSSYEDGLIGKDEATVLLGDLDIAPDVIVFHLAHSDFKVAKRELNENITAIGDLLMLGQISQSDARSQLSVLGVSPTKQENLIFKWTKEVPPKVKVPSKAELDAFIKAGLIDAPDYFARMQKLGYSYDDTLLFIAELMKTSKAEAEVAVAAAQVFAPIP